MKKALTSGRLLAGLLLALAPLVAWAECKRQALDVPVRLVNHRPIVSISIQGKELPMLLDTGAFHSMLMPSVAASLQLPLSDLPYDLELRGFTGRIEARMTKVKELQVYGLPLRNVEFIVGGNELGSGIQGILGRNLLGIGDVEYDLGQGRMRLHFLNGDCSEAAPVYWSTDTPVIEADLEAGRSSNVLTVSTRINDSRVLALLDTGAPSSTLSLRQAQRAGLKREEMSPLGRTGGAGAGSAQVWLAPVASFELGGQTVRNLQLEVADVRREGPPLLLGLDYFLSHRIYVSRERRKLYATWNGGPIFTRGALQREEDAAGGAQAAAVPLDDADALARVAAATATRGDGARALEQFNRVIELAPAKAEYRMARARVLAGLGQVAAASNDLDEALRLQPQLHEARLMRAQLMPGNRVPRQTLLTELRALDAALPPEDNARYELASMYARLGMLPEALQQWALWTPTRSDDRRLGDVMQARCWLRARLNQQLEEAAKDCEGAVDRDPRMPAYQHSLGWLRLRQGDHRAAQKAFDRVIAQDPKHAWALYGRGIAQQRQGQEAAAQGDLQAARAVRPRIDAEVSAAGFELAR